MKKSTVNKVNKIIRKVSRALEKAQEDFTDLYNVLVDEDNDADAETLSSECIDSSFDDWEKDCQSWTDNLK